MITALVPTAVTGSCTVEFATVCHYFLLVIDVFEITRSLISLLATWVDSPGSEIEVQRDRSYFSSMPVW